MFRLMAAVAMMLCGGPAWAGCNSYKARDFDIRIVEDANSITVSWERYSSKLDKVVTKPWGVLQEAAVDMSDPAQPTSMLMREKIDGKDAIIFDSIVFLPACD